MAGPPPMDEHSPRDQRWSPHAIIDGVFPVGLCLLGLLHPESPARWFESLVFSFAVIAGPVLAGSALITLLSKRFGTRIQGPRLKPAPMAREAFESARAMLVAASFMAWPLTQWRLGHP